MLKCGAKIISLFNFKVNEEKLVYKTLRLLLSVNWSGVICQLFILGIDVREVAHDIQH